MAVYNQFDIHPYNLALGVHDFSADVFKIALTDTLPVLTDELLSDIVELSPGNGYSTGGSTTTVSVTKVGNTALIFCTDVLFTASGGAVGPLRYAVLYNDTQTSPLKPLIGFWDRGSSVTLAANDAVLIDFDPINGALVIT